MAKQSLDVLITPAHVLPTCPHGTTGDFVQSASYQYLANLIDWTAGVVPVVTPPLQTNGNPARI
eukprot:COSAG03_NODE_79_length_14054_cov_53.206951_7_plen_64_part_00